MSKRFRPDFGITLSPIKTTSESSLETPIVPTAAQLQSTPVKQTRRSESDHYSATPVSVKVQWPSETRERTLKKDLESLGKMLVRGTYKQIARASWNNPRFRKELQALALKAIDKECHELCSEKRLSILRSPSKEKLQTLSFEKLNNELNNRAPSSSAILHTACVNNRNATKPNEWMPTIGMAAAVLLRNRSSHLNAVQLLLSVFLYHSSWTVSKYKN